MVVKDLIKDSVFSTIATVELGSINKLADFLAYNYEVYSAFSTVIISYNVKEGTSQKTVDMFETLWKENISNCVFLRAEGNKGHMFGTIDLEERILKYVKENLPEVKYLFKSMDDVLTLPNFLDLEIEEADFYYLPGFSAASILHKEDSFGIKEYETFNDRPYQQQTWTPQTTFFIIDVTKIDSLYGPDVEEKKKIFEEVRDRLYPSIKPWEVSYSLKFDCETHLGRTTKDLKKFCLISNKFAELLEFVKVNKVGDPSHKNLYFEGAGLCHYHFYTADVHTI